MSGRVTVDLERGIIKVRGALSNLDKTTMQLAAPKAAAAIEALVHKTRGARLAAPPCSCDQAGVCRPTTCCAPRRHSGAFRSDALPRYPVETGRLRRRAVLDRFAALSRAAEEARLDVSQAGKVTVNFVTSLHDQLALTLEEKGWTKPALINWLDRRLPNSARADITRTSSALFIGKVLDALADRDNDARGGGAWQIPPGGGSCPRASRSTGRFGRRKPISVLCCRRAGWISPRRPMSVSLSMKTATGIISPTKVRSSSKSTSAVCRRSRRKRRRARLRNLPRPAARGSDLDSQHVTAAAFLLAANLDGSLLSRFRVPVDRWPHPCRRI